MPSCNPGDNGRVTINQDHDAQSAADACQATYDWNNGIGFGRGGLMNWRDCSQNPCIPSESRDCGTLFLVGSRCPMAWQDYYLNAVPEWCLSSTSQNIFKDDANWLP